MDRQPPAVLAHPDPKGAWAGLASVGLVERARETAGKPTGEPTGETHSSLSRLDGEVATFADAVRRHWGIEIRRHWVLDIVFRADDRRVRVGHATEHVAVLRHLALKLLRQDRSRTVGITWASRGHQVGITATRLKAGWAEAYLLHLLNG